VKHRPDGLLTLPDGNVIAIETERRLKTRARYQSIMASHLLARTRKQDLRFLCCARSTEEACA
jgi:hypothetical protein